MFDGRIYRAAFVPLLFVLAIAGFSLAGRPGPLRSTLAPDAFEGPRAFADLQMLLKRFPDRRPGSPGDDRLAAYLASTLRGLGGPSGTSVPGATAGGFRVITRRIRAQTPYGARTITTVIAERPGSTGSSPVAILAHRDAVAPGSVAELSGTAALIELARVFAQSETRRTIVLVSTSGGSGGDAGAADFARHYGHSLDAAIVLGDLAGTLMRKPLVLPFSGAVGMAPESLQRTLDAAISQEAGVNPGRASDSGQLGRLAFPLASGEEAPLNEAGVPSVLLQVSGERGPSQHDPIGPARLLGFGRAVLGAVYALDEGPDLARDFSPRVSLGRKLLPAWAIRLLMLALLLPPLLVSVDALARLRRRGEGVWRWILWVLTASLPFFTGAVFAVLLGAIGIVAAPTGQLSSAALGADGSAPAALACTGVVLVLGLLAWPALVRRLELPLRPAADGATLAVMLVLLGVALIAWVFNPFACLLLVPAAHLWLLAAEARRHPPMGVRGVGSLAVLIGALPLALPILVYAGELDLGPVGLGESAVLALVGGQLGLPGALLWSVALGCLLTVVLLARSHPASLSGTGVPEWGEIATRGPTSYAGPGSLGGTESALRR
jgi:hypothetical protein